MRIAKIGNADSYRDGGSYGFSFEADDGNWYEFFLQTTALSKEKTTTHLAPVLYRERHDGGTRVQTFTWAEAKEFTARLRYMNMRLNEILNIVDMEGQNVPD